MLKTNPTKDHIMDKVITLPSEAAQHLAIHLMYNQELYTEENQAMIHHEELAWVIQEYWDSLI